MWVRLAPVLVVGVAGLVGAFVVPSPHAGPGPTALFLLAWGSMAGGATWFAFRASGIQGRPQTILAFALVSALALVGLVGLYMLVATGCWSSPHACPVGQ